MVRNLEDTLSINHNWLNAFNLHWGWALLQRERAEAAAAIEDCRYLCYHAALAAKNPYGLCHMPVSLNEA